jgi:hypothetical protein
MCIDPKWIASIEVTDTFRGSDGADRGFNRFSGV